MRPRGRVHLVAPQDVGGAGRQAEAAVNAVGDKLFRRRVMRVEVRGLGRFQLCQVVMSDASEEAAGLRMWLGSNCCLTARIRSMRIGQLAPAVDAARARRCRMMSEPPACFADEFAARGGLSAARTGIYAVMMPAAWVTAIAAERVDGCDDLRRSPMEAWWP